MTAPRADEPGTLTDVRSSALLQPFNHLLDASPSAVSPETNGTGTPSRDGSFELVKGVFREELEGEQAIVRPGAYSAAGTSVGMDGLSRRGSFASSIMLGGRDGTRTPIEFTPDEEEKLDEEWGISRIGSNFGSEFGVDEGDMTGIGLRQFPRSESGMLRDLLREKEEEALLEQRQAAYALKQHGEDGSEVEEVMETRSMPDLDRPRKLSFAASILDELDGRLQGKSTTLSPEEEEEARERAQAMVKANSDGPRIKVIERRKRSRSLSTNFGLENPRLPDVAPAEPSTLEDFVVGAGKARTDSLFSRPASALAFTSIARDRESSTASRTSNDLHPSSSGSNRAVPSTTSPIFNPGRFRSTTHDTTRTATSSFGDSDPTRPPSAMSMTPSVFTSQFDPNIIRQQREKQLAERPNFTNPEAGKPPNVILMPAPLAGQRPQPPKKPRKEGPSGDSSEEVEEEDEEELEEEKPQRPAGALYGRSLMDIMAERKALLKAQQRAYVPGSDGRRGMMDWKDSPAAQESLAAQGALAKLEGRSNAEDTDEVEEEVPLALLPAGGATRRKPKTDAITKSRSGLSIFGPDMLYQRELAAARKLEEEERLEREESERRAQEVEQKRQVKDERRRLKKKMGSKALEHRDLVDQQLVSGEFKTPGDLLRESQRASRAPVPPIDSSPTAPRAHGPAPSISIPTGLSNSASDWFEPLKKKAAADGTELEEMDIEDDPRYTPRTLSGGLLEQHRKTGFFDSDSEEDDDQILAVPSSRRQQEPKSAKASPDVKRLALPGEPSSQGHGNEAEDEDEVPLGRRYSRGSLMLSPPPRAALPTLDLDIPSTAEPLASFAGQGDEDEDEEDDKPLGHRYSTIRAIDPDEDDVPLAIRRLSLAPSSMVATQYVARFQAPRATITALEEEGDDPVEVIQSQDPASKSDGGDSDDLPLGLKQAQHNPPMMNYGVPMHPPFQQPQPFYGFPPASQFFAPAPMHPHDPTMQLALAQMQMQAAMMSGGAAGGNGEGIENWRRGVT